MNSFCTFYIVRHAQSLANATGLRAGQMDFDISEEGVVQAQVRAQDLKDIHFDLAFSSDLLRATRTAEILVAEHKLEIQTTKQLRERSWGKQLEGGTVEETQKFLKDWQKLSYEERFHKKVFDDMESDEELMGRFTTFLRETALAYPRKTILIVAHGNLMRTFMVHLGMGKVEEFARETLKTTGYIVLRSDGVEFEVVKTVGIEKVSSTNK